MHRLAASLALVALMLVPPPALAAEETFAFSGRTEGELCLGTTQQESCLIVVEPVNTPWELPPETFGSIAFSLSFMPLPGGLADPFVVLQRLVDGEWQSQWENGHVIVSMGSSPLETEWSLEGYPEGSRLRLAVYAGSDRAIGGNVFLYTGAPVEFSMTGTLRRA